MESVLCVKINEQRTHFRSERKMQSRSGETCHGNFQNIFHINNELNELAIYHVRSLWDDRTLS